MSKKTNKDNKIKLICFDLNHWLKILSEIHSKGEKVIIKVMKQQKKHLQLSNVAKIINFDTKIIKPVKNEVLSIAQILLKKKFNKIEEIIKYTKNPNFRSKLFDAINMMVSLHEFNFEILKIVKKEFNQKNLINWAYPQIRLDVTHAKQFATPLHQDGWFLDKNKIGIVLWTTLMEKGSSLLVSNKRTVKNLKKHSYFGIECVDNVKLERYFLKYGQMLIFDKYLLHKSPTDDNRITIQLRYEEINRKFKKRTVSQVTDMDVRNYWLKQVNK